MWPSSMTRESTPDQPTHLDEQGRVRMVEVGEKEETARVATARGIVRLSRKAFDAIREGTAPKGDVFATARVAGIQAAKRTGEWIPLCHPIGLTSVQVDLELDADDASVRIESTAKCVGRTGVEMEAMVAVSAAALTIYDMVKSIDRGTQISDIRLIYKAGGKSGEWRSE